MTTNELHIYLSGKKGVTKEFPFGPEVSVFKVMGKIFALVMHESDLLRVNLKCNPDDALILRSQFGAVQPGYHMNKEHWNTVIFDGTITDDTLKMMIDHSYKEVVKKLKKSDRETLSSTHLKK